MPLKVLNKQSKNMIPWGTD